VFTCIHYHDWFRDGGCGGQTEEHCELCIPMRVDWHRPCGGTIR
jgi:hypothetical protein